MQTDTAQVGTLIDSKTNDNLPPAPAIGTPESPRNAANAAGECALRRTPLARTLCVTYARRSAKAAYEQRVAFRAVESDYINYRFAL